MVGRKQTQMMTEQATEQHTETDTSSLASQLASLFEPARTNRFLAYIKRDGVNLVPVYLIRDIEFDCPSPKQQTIVIQYYQTTNQDSLGTVWDAWADGCPTPLTVEFLTEKGDITQRWVFATVIERIELGKLSYAASVPVVHVITLKSLGMTVEQVA